MPRYVPTTEEVLAHWDRSHTEVGAAALRRWLASVKAEAWDEAVEALDRSHGDIYPIAVKSLDRRNPHRKETPDESP